MKKINFGTNINDIKKIIITVIVIISVIIILPMIIIGINKKESSKENQIKEKENINEYLQNGKIQVYFSKDDKVEEIDFEEYIKGVVSSEMQVSFEMEALKAQAIAARNFSLNKIKYKCVNGKGAHICDTVHCQVYKTKEMKMKEWGEKGEENWKKISTAVDATKGQVMYFEDEIVKSAQFFSTSGGRTENVKDVFGGDVPYLKSVKSEGEDKAPKYISDKEIKIKDFIDTINSKYEKAKIDKNNLKQSIEIKSHTEGGAVKEIRLGKELISGVDFRKLFELNSANFTLSFKGDKINVKCRGYGHGVGMSQWGANRMAEDGKDYKEIITNYYSGVVIKKIY